MAADSEITPAGAVDNIYKEHVIGNIYNPHNFGGYLIFRGIKTFIDGRNDQLFFGDFTTKLHDAIEKDPTRFLAYLLEYNVSVALVFPKSAEARELEHSVDWQKKYSDAISELYVKQ